MRPGDWLMVEGYDGLDVDLALVTATSTSPHQLTDDKIRWEYTANHAVPVETDRWFSVLKKDRDHVGNVSFHTEGSGKRWVDVLLCSYQEGDDQV